MRKISKLLVLVLIALAVAAVAPQFVGGCESVPIGGPAPC